MTAEVLTEGRLPHRCSPPQDAYRYGWNAVVRAACGHLFVRRHSLGFLLPLGDHYPQFVRLRPWHVGACVRLTLRWVLGPLARSR